MTNTIKKMMRKHKKKKLAAEKARLAENREAQAGSMVKIRITATKEVL